MVPAPLYFAFVLTSLALIAFPGPNVALIISISMTHGRRAGLATVAGTSSAMALQLALTVTGMSAILAASASWFSWLRWAGAVYLVYLGVRAWRAAPLKGTQSAPAPPSVTVFTRGVLISLTNPKTLLFFGAFLPQFVSAERPPLTQLTMLAVSFLALAIVFDSVWALLAHRAGEMFVERGRWRNRVQGSLLIGAGLGVALARKS